jgi:hypothetical protein
MATSCRRPRNLHKGRRKALSSALRQIADIGVSLPLSNQGITFAVRYDQNSPRKRLIGYARVSTYGQTLDAQLDQLRSTGCTGRKIYREEVTGAGRPART